MQKGDKIYLNIKKWKVNKIDKRHHDTKNLWLYYNDVVYTRCDIPTYSPDYDKRKGDPAYFMEFYDSLRKRLGLLYANYDWIKELYSKEKHNDIYFLLSYFVPNFIILNYSIIENIAWMLVYFYDLPFSLNTNGNRTINNKTIYGRLKVSMKPNSQFIKEIKEENTTIHNYLITPDFQKFEEDLRGFRDLIQHRHKINFIHCGDATGKKFNEIEYDIKIPKEPSFLFSDLMGKHNQKEDNKYSENLLEFCQRNIIHTENLVKFIMKQVGKKTNHKRIPINYPL